MKCSVSKATKSLLLSVEEATALRSATRDWLEHVYQHDDKRIARLQAERIRIQAARFLQQRGSRFFKTAIDKRLVESLQDQNLLLKVAAIMTCQVEYKRRLQKGKTGQHQSQSNIESDIESDSTASTINSDKSNYQPSNATLDTPRLKTHNTRRNTQPGMPVRPSIEDGSFDGRDAVISLPYICLQDDMDLDEAAIDQEIAMTGDSNRVEDRLPPVVTNQVNNTCTLSTDTASHTLLAQDSIDVRRRQSSTRQKISSLRRRLIDIEIPHTAHHLNSDISQPSEELLPFSPHTYDFDLLVPPLQEQAGTIETLSEDLTRSSPLGSRPRKVEAAQCEQTPPSSARSLLGHGPTGRGMFEEMEFKPRFPDVVEELNHIVTRKKRKVFLGGDHYELVDVNQAVYVLQNVFDALNDMARECQRRAQQGSESLFEQQAAEMEALHMCRVNRKLRRDKKIWITASSQSLGTAIEIE